MPSPTSSMPSSIFSSGVFSLQLLIKSRVPIAKMMINDKRFIELYYLLVRSPLNNERTKRIKKIKNRIFAIPAAPAAIPPKPKIPAMMAITTNKRVQRNILLVFRLVYISNSLR